MNYLQYYPVDIVNGEGTRCTLFVSGCTHGCKGCYNQKSWSFNAGVPFDKMMEEQILRDLKDTRIKRQGLTLFNLDLDPVPAAHVDLLTHPDTGTERQDKRQDQGDDADSA